MQIVHPVACLSHCSIKIPTFTFLLYAPHTPAQLDCLPPCVSLSFVLILSLDPGTAYSLAWWNPFFTRASSSWSIWPILTWPHWFAPSLLFIGNSFIILILLNLTSITVTYDLISSMVKDCILPAYFFSTVLIIFKERLLNKHLLDLKQLCLLVKGGIMHPIPRRAALSWDTYQDLMR